MHRAGLAGEQHVGGAPVKSSVKDDAGNDLTFRLTLKGVGLWWRLKFCWHVLRYDAIQVTGPDE